MKILKRGALYAILISIFSLSLASVAVAATINENDLWTGHWDGGNTVGNGYQNEIGDPTGLGNSDPREIAARVINILLGFLGIIAVVLILVGGFMWMTAAGNDDKVATAKKVMVAGVIGLVIVLAAFGIARFVVNALMDATK
ncbi:MAG: pilin [Patescibacteria group bacterium]|jgi:type IV secretory pathway VirB2 component (pilin)